MLSGGQYILLYCTVLYCTLLQCTVLYCPILYCNVLYCTVLYCTLLDCSVLYCSVLYSTVLHFNTLYCTLPGKWYQVVCSPLYFCVYLSCALLNISFSLRYLYYVKCSIMWSIGILNYLCMYTVKSWVVTLSHMFTYLVRSRLLISKNPASNS